MNYAVIYVVDTSEFDHAENYGPPLDQIQEKLWAETEGDDQYQIPDRFVFEGQAERAGWETGHHSKWCAQELDQEEFDAFVDECKLFAVEGDGSALGMFGYGMTKAVVFEGYDGEDVTSYAYVTPYCESEELPEWLTEQGEHVPAALVDTHGQRYLFRGVKDKREPWDAVAAVVRRQYF